MPHSTQTTPFVYSDEQLSEYAKNTHENDFKFQKLVGPMFPESGKKREDVAQHSLGECFFDAAIISMIDSCPELLDDILTIKENGKVVGKIYIEKDGLYHPEYFELDYTDFLPKPRGISKIIYKDDLFHEHANYVCMLEKLYAVSKLHEGITKKNSNNGATQDSKNFVSFLNSGIPGDVFSRLTGEKSQSLKIEFTGRRDALTSRQNEKTTGIMVAYVMILQQLLQETGDLNKKFDDIVENLTAKNEVEKNYKTPEIKKQIISFLEDNKNKNRPEIENEVEKLLEALISYGYNQLVPKKEFSGVALPQYFDLLRSNIDHIENESKNLREKNHNKIEMDGAYSSIENAIFDKIKTALESGKAVAIASKKIEFEKGAPGHKESIKNGIAGAHSYAVHDVLEYGDKKYIAITNPWHFSYKRKYIQDKNNDIIGVEDLSNDSISLADTFGSEIEKTSSNTEKRVNSFFVELSDFYTHTNHIYISAAHPNGKLLFIKNFESLLQWYAPTLLEEDDYKEIIELALTKIKNIRSGENDDGQFLDMFYIMACLEKESTTPEKRILSEAIREIRREFGLYDTSEISMPSDEKFTSVANIVQQHLNAAKIIKNKSAKSLVLEIENKALENNIKFHFPDEVMHDTHTKLAIISAEIALGNKKMGALRSFLPEIQSCWQYEKLQASINKDAKLLSKISNLENAVDNQATQPELHGKLKLLQCEKEDRLSKIIQKIRAFLRRSQYQISFWKEREKHTQGDGESVVHTTTCAAAAA